MLASFAFLASAALQSPSKMSSYLRHFQTVKMSSYRQHFFFEILYNSEKHLSSLVKYRKRGMEKLPPLFKLACCQELSLLRIKLVCSQLVQNTLEISFMPLQSACVSLRQGGRRKRFT